MFVELISLRDSRRGTSVLRGLEDRWIWARGRIGDGIIEFWVDAESEIFDFRGLDDRTSIEHLLSIYRTSIENLSNIHGMVGRGNSRLRGLEDGEIWDRNQIGDGIIEFSILGGCEIWDFRFSRFGTFRVGSRSRIHRTLIGNWWNIGPRPIENLSNIYRRHEPTCV